MNWPDTALKWTKEKNQEITSQLDAQPPGVKHIIFQAFQVENSN